MNKYKAVIFDLDGVLCFTDHYHYLAWKALADKYNIEFTESDNNQLRGVSRAESLEIILKKYHGTPFTNEQKKEMLEEKNNTYKEFLKEMVPEDATTEVVYTLMHLVSEGYKLGIGSSSKNTKFILEKIGLIKMFDKISDGTNITFSKPHPEVFLKAAEYLGLKPEECLVIEDARAGIDAACAGGFDSCALGDASGYEKATHSLTEFKQILEIVHGA